MNDELREALRWWIRVLATDITQLHEWTEVEDVPVHLFTDASGGNGGYLGAVLFADGHVWWTHRDIPDKLRAAFCNRKDNQIMGLELLGIALGLSSFSHLIRNRKVIIHCDNTGAEVSPRGPQASAMFYSVCGRWP